MPFKILVIDDEIYNKTDTISAIPTLLEREGYEVAATADGNAAYDLVSEFKPDLIVLDIGFPGQNITGIEICQSIRLDDSWTPIILITSTFKETDDVLAGFQAEADDYVRRPCDNREILARIRANLPQEMVEVDSYIRIDFKERGVQRNNGGKWCDVQLRPLEFRLLKVFVLNAGRIMESTRLKDRVWDREDISEGVLAVYIRRLRERLEPDPTHPVYIETIHGIGYRFNGKPKWIGQCKSQRR
jgi:DNA-binding response OmpR family regulator